MPRDLPREMEAMKETLQVDDFSAWRNPHREAFEYSDEDKRSFFFEWIDNQPWFRDALRREGEVSEFSAKDVDHSPDVEMLKAILSACKDHPAIHPVFVFGSNLPGRHKRGAARYAESMYGAEWGIGHGRSGQSYAIPSRDVDVEPLAIERIRECVQKFLEYAGKNPKTEFMLTRIGCGLAGFDDSTIAPLFADAPQNVYLPGKWESFRSKEKPAPRVVVAGSRNFSNQDKAFSYLDRILSKSPVEPVIVSGGAGGADRMGEIYALSKGLRLERFPAWWNTEGKAAMHLRNQRMAWRGTHLVAFWDHHSSGTRSMIDMAKRSHLACKVIDTR